MSKRRARRMRGRQMARGGPPPALVFPGAAPKPPAHIPLSPPRQSLTWREVFGTTFWIMAVATCIAGAACWNIKGADVFRASFASDIDLLLFIAPRFGAGMVIAAFLQKLIHRDKVARYISEGAGLKAVAIATVAGGMTPGGPMTSFPLVRALREVGTGRSALVAYITSWSTMGFQRILNWELPLMGPDFALLRLVSSLPLPLIAGLISRLLPPEPEPEPEPVQNPVPEPMPLKQTKGSAP